MPRGVDDEAQRQQRGERVGRGGFAEPDGQRGVAEPGDGEHGGDHRQDQPARFAEAAHEPSTAAATLQPQEFDGRGMEQLVRHARGWFVRRTSCRRREVDVFEAGVGVDVFEADAELFDRSEESLRAVVEDQHVGAQVLDHRQHVGADHDRGPGGGALAERSLEGADALRVEAGERFVEQDRGGIVQVAAADGEFLPHAAREAAGGRVEF